MRKYFYILLTALLGFTAYLIMNQSNTRKKTKTIEAKRAEVTRTIKLSGSLEPEKEVAVKSRLSGIIDQIFVNVGDQVQKGAPLARIHIIADPNSLEQAANQLKNEKVQLDADRINYKRKKTLFAQSVIAAEEMQEAETQLKVRENEYQSAKNRLEIAKQGYRKNNHEFSDIVRATASGTVLQVPLKIGASVTERNNYNDGSTVAVIANLQAFRFRSSVTESDVRFLETGQELKIAVNALAKSFIAKLIELTPKAEENNGIVRFPLLAELKNCSSEKKMFSGMSATAEIVAQRDTSNIVVEERNLIFRNDSVFVELLNTNDKVEETAVTLGLSDGIKTTVTLGLQEGDLIVVQ